MDNHIVQEFQNLRVFPSGHFLDMEELVKDFTNALEESAYTQKSKDSLFSSKRPCKKRKGKKRRTFIIETGNISEASESSIEEALKDYIENIAQQSDSDDVNINQRVARLTMPLSSNFVPSVESDSVTESFSPMRPQRRKKKCSFKSMVVDPEPSINPKPDESFPNYMVKNDCKKHREDSSLCPSSSVYPGKRKRSSKSRTDFPPREGGQTNGKQDKEEDEMELSSQESNNSSTSLSSYESDGLLTNDEGREGDDEQSDYYLESGPTCGIPGIIPWWEEKEQGEESNKDKEFQQILNGTFEHMSRSSQLAFKSRLTRLMAKSGREFRFGRRKLKEKRPGYTVTKFLHDRQVWNSMQGVFPNPGWNSANGSNDSKRIRKTPPPYPPEGYIGGEAEPIPDSNKGSKMLKNMGWTPGMGLGAEGSGIKNPVLAYRRPRRQGLGCGKLADSEEMAS